MEPWGTPILMAIIGEVQYLNLHIDFSRRDSFPLAYKQGHVYRKGRVFFKECYVIQYQMLFESPLKGGW